MQWYLRRQEIAIDDIPFLERNAHLPSGASEQRLGLRLMSTQRSIQPPDMALAPIDRLERLCINKLIKGKPCLTNEIRSLAGRDGQSGPRRCKGGL